MLVCILVKTGRLTLALESSPSSRFQVWPGRGVRTGWVQSIRIQFHGLKYKEWGRTNTVPGSENKDTTIRACNMLTGWYKLMRTKPENEHITL